MTSPHDGAAVRGPARILDPQVSARGAERFDTPAQMVVAAK